MFDVDEFLVDYEKKDSTPEAAVKYCGMTSTYIDVNGIPRITRYRCKKWRECDNCRRVRHNEFVERFNNIDTEDLVAITCENEVAKKLLRKKKVRGDDYFRSPISDDAVIITISQSLLDEVKFDDYLQLFDLSEEIPSPVIDAYVDIPLSKRTSGNLGKINKEKKEKVYDSPQDENDEVLIETVSLVSPLSQEETSSLFIEAIKRTSPLNNDDYQSIQLNRIFEFEMLLKENDVEYYSLHRSNRTVSKQWLDNNFVLIHDDGVKIKTNIDFDNKDINLYKAVKDKLKQEFSEKEVEFI